MSTKVFVDGQEGTTGLRINEYLSARADIEVLRIDESLRKDVAARRALINESDVTFLCLPDVASRESASLVENERTCIIDASTAFRTDAQWAYGLPELEAGARARIAASTRIAVPGCHASAFVLGARPLLAAGLVPSTYPVSCYSLTGYSGGGKKMIAEYEAEESSRLDSPRPYALGLTHKHLPEMAHHTGLSQPPIFTPIVGNFLKGLALTAYWHPQLMAKSVSARAVHDCLASYYEKEPFVRVMPFELESNLDHGFFDVQGCNDTNRVDIFVFGNDERIITIARLDNLGKGAAGAAIQCMNLRIGAPENAGLKA